MLSDVSTPSEVNGIDSRVKTVACERVKGSAMATSHAKSERGVVVVVLNTIFPIGGHLAD